MFKYYLTIAIISTLLTHQPLVPCPCSASSSDKRPFFEQYESEASSYPSKEQTIENENTETKVSNS